MGGGKVCYCKLQVGTGGLNWEVPVAIGESICWEEACDCTPVGPNWCSIWDVPLAIGEAIAWVSQLGNPGLNRENFSGTLLQCRGLLVLWSIFLGHLGNLLLSNLGVPCELPNLADPDLAN